MTVRDLVSAMLRRWYVVAVAMILAIVGGYLLQRAEGVYTTRTVVSFLLPDKTTLSPNSGLDDASVIAFAGVVARKVNGGTPSQVTYSADAAPFYGAGVRQGVLVSLPNAGNQWITSYLRAEVVLQIVGPSEQWVAAKQADLLLKVVHISDAQQSSVKTETARIRASPVLPTKQIFHIVPSRVEVVAAFCALLIAALIVGAGGAVLVDRMLRGRKVRASERVPHRLVIEGRKK